MSTPPNPQRLKFLPTAATFRLREPLGVGAMGTVYRAESDDVPSPVAVKILHPTFAHDERMVDRFQREIVIMERLHHPHIVRHYGGGMMDGKYFYAMELLSHGSLRERLEQQGPLPWPLAALYMSQIAGALQHAHNHGIVHRDLKPANLFFHADGGVVLGDFGIARDLRSEEGADPSATVGTYAYMSPEQIRSERDVTGKADLYSLGCVGYEMLSGEPPFSGANFAQVWDQHLNAPPRGFSERSVDCPEWLEQMVMQLLQKDPHRRPFNARSVQGLVRDRLEEAFGPDYIQQIRDSCSPAPFRRRRPRHRDDAG